MKLSETFIIALIVILSTFTVFFAKWNITPSEELDALRRFNAPLIDKHYKCVDVYLLIGCEVIQSKI